MADHFVVHFEIAGKDAKALQDFYKGLFGWDITTDNEANYGMVPGTQDGIGGGVTGGPDGEPYVTIYVSCDGDIQATLDKAVELGGTKVTDVMQPPGAPTLAHFNDPDGNFIGLVETQGETPPPPQGGGDPVNWFEISGTNSQKTRDYYSKLFGWTINADNPMEYGEFLASQGSSGGIFGGMGDPRVTVYATVDDLDAKLARAKELGGTIAMEKTAVPGGPTIGTIADPAGNLTGMILKGTTGAS